MKNVYFTKQTEEFILQYQTNKDDKLFTKEIYPAFMKLVSGVISKYNFEVNFYSIKDLINIVTTELYLKINKYRGGDAFNFFTRCTKNYILNMIEKQKKNVQIDLFDDNKFYNNY